VQGRHNANILLSSTGHLIHIDFGFLFLNSPGNNLHFESSPFKLTAEYLQVISPDLNTNTPLFHYFTLLFIRGFFELRSHLSEILSLLHPLSFSYLPCFLYALDATTAIQQLQHRFMVDCPEETCIIALKSLIHQAVNNWRSVQYDTFQYYSSGIL